MSIKHALYLALLTLSAGGLFAEEESDTEHYAQVAEMDARITIECPALFDDKDPHITRFHHRYGQELAVKKTEAKIRPIQFRCEFTPNESERLEWKVQPHGWGSWREITAVKLQGTAWSVQASPDFPGTMICKEPDLQDVPAEVQQALDLLQNVVAEYRAAPLVLHTMGPDVIQEWLTTSTFFKGQHVQPKQTAGRMRLKASSDWQKQTLSGQDAISWELLRSWEPFVQVIEALNDMHPEVSAKCSVECHWNPMDKLDYRLFVLLDIQAEFKIPGSNDTVKTLLHIDRKMFSDK